MANKYIDVVNNDYESGERAVYEGLGLDKFAFEPYFSLAETQRYGLSNIELIQNYLLPLSKKVDIYATDDSAAIRVENGKVRKVIGDVYFITNSEIHKI